MEALEFIKLQKADFIHVANKSKIKMNPLTYDFAIEHFDKTIKELEILSILEENCVITKGDGRWKGIEIIECILGSESTEEYQKVKEWLLNDIH